METDGFWGLAKGLFVALMIVFAIILLVNMVVQSKSNRLEVDKAANY